MNHVVIDTDKILLDDQPVNTDGISGIQMLSTIYKNLSMGYPKFHKMDPLCRLGFIAAELLFSVSPMQNGDNHAVIAIGHGGSIVNDTRYHKTIAHPDAYFPSPAVFVYTLANIVTGEIAIRHKIYGESSSYLISTFDPATITQLLLSTFADSGINRITGGWIDCNDDNDFSLRFVTIDRTTPANDIQKFFKSNPIK